MGICVPATCTNLDVMILIYECECRAIIVITSVADLTPMQIQDLFCYVYVACEEPNDITQDWFGVTVMFFILFVVLLIIVGTSYDYFQYQPTMMRLPKKRVSCKFACARCRTCYSTRRITLATSRRSTQSLK